MAVSAPQRSLVRVLAKPVATVLGVGVVATLAVVSPGYDAQEVPRVETNVWVTRDDGQYARVNTELAEFDTVHTVADPVGLVQSGPNATVYSRGYAQSWAIDPAAPADFAGSGTEDGAAGVSTANTPAGTQSVSYAGSTMVYLTKAGEVFIGSLSTPGANGAQPWQADPFGDVEVEEDEEPPRYFADAVAVDGSGRIVMYSAEEQAVRTYSLSAGEFVNGIQSVPSAPEAGTEVEFVLVGGRWVLSAPSDSLLWIEGLGTPVATGLTGAGVMQSGWSDASEVLLADAASLIAVRVKDGTVTQLASGQGTPAAPIVVGGVSYAAWVSTSSATLWSSDSPEPQSLAVDATELADVQAVSPVFRSNGDRAVLTETATGMVWTLPAGTLIGVNEWDPIDSAEQVEGTVEVSDVIEQQPPVAIDDVFGVRRGAVVTLPLVLNDNDANKKDVLTIDGASISDLSDDTFGSLGLVANDQQAVVRVSADSGSASFTYEVTDGYDNSAPASVTLTVVPDDVNTAPVWCGSPECKQEWPSPQLTPGGYVSVPILYGWVDLEGDTIALADAQPQDPQAPIRVVPTADGKVVIRHLDPNAGGGVIPINVTVIDSFGATATQVMELRVAASPAFEVKPIAVSASVGETRLVAIDEYVTGGSGSYRLLDAIPAQGSDQALTVVPGTSNGIIEISATEPGRHFAIYTMEDTETLVQQTATIRYTVEGASRPLAAPPLTTFVRPGEDATVNILEAVQNSTGRVLMVAEATTSDPELNVAVVGQAFVRVSGTTLDGLPGKVGVADILIADGDGGSTTTQLSVFLLAPSHGVGPIAAPDTLSVRAGAQVDIPVLDNDVSPRGERLVLLPEMEGSGTAGELAFPSGQVVRYLAPSLPGEYVLTYWVYLENDPSRLDSASVTVTVLPAGSNRAPQTPTIAARVLAGQFVTVPVLSEVLDPDGDDIILTDVGQPVAGSGVMALSADGNSVVYRAPADGVPGGQLSVPYTVMDSEGAESTGLVRVGVLTRELVDVAPVTYSDYVGVLLGSSFPVSVSPLLNDRDPLGGGLEVISIVPNAPAGSTEYDRLAALIDATTSLEDGIIALKPGNVEGTHSYVYTVQSDSSFSTAEGLIVLGVSEEPAPDALYVTDTTLTVRNRQDLVTGVDVVAGKVQWQTGDVGDLTLALWGSAADDYSVSGHSVSGPLPEGRTVIPFSLTGPDATGKETTSYGFLRVPAFNDLRLQAKAGLTVVEVKEQESVELLVRDYLDIGPADVVELRQDDSFFVQRDQAVCTPTGALAVTYSAGREAPWSDSCSVAVRLDGQTGWTVVAIPVNIEPRDPQAILSPISRTISPAAIEEFSLIPDMITWEGGRVGDIPSLNLAIEHSGTEFIVTRNGDQLSVQALASARPGTRETIRVTSSAYGGLTSAITLVVGTAAPDAPKGATFSHQCDVSRGATCSIPAVGVAGEYDPFAGAPGAGLKLVSVGTTGSVSCPAVSVSMASTTAMVATWPAGPRPIGGECVVDYTVSDAQGRTGLGTMTLDVLGYPQTPASVTTAKYTGTSVTLSVDLGGATQAHPAVTGVSIWEGAVQAPASCSPSGPSRYSCLIEGLENGTKHTYTARAVNSVGDSLDTTAHTTWAYQPPQIISFTAENVYRPGTTKTTQGVVKLDVVTSPDTKAIKVDGKNTTINRTGDTSGAEVPFAVGPQIVKLIPISVFDPPTSSNNEGSASTQSLNVIGSPSYTGNVSSTATPTNATVTGGSFNANYSPATADSIWVAWEDHTPNCTMDGAGKAVVSGGDIAATSTSNVLSTGLDQYVEYRAAVCTSNGFGAAMSSSAYTLLWDAPAAPTGTLTYTVSTAPQYNGTQIRFWNYTSPSIDSVNKLVVKYRYNGSAYSDSFSLNADTLPNIEVAYCLRKVKSSNPDDVLCGAWSGVSKTAPSLRTTVTITGPSLNPSQCKLDPQPSDVQVSNAANASKTITVDTGNEKYVVTFSGDDFGALGTIDVPGNFCIPVIIPDPLPDPDPAP